jgi:hypothetical protein
MNRRLLRIAIVILTGTLLLLLALFLSSPQLYSPENASSTPRHANLLSLKKTSGDEASRILPLLQDLMGSTSTITISLETKDFSAAERDLLNSLDRSAHLENLIIQLNLSDTDLDVLRQQNDQNLADLQELLNLSQRFSELETVEIQYRREGRPDLLYSISYEGETIRNRVGALAQEYSSRKDGIVNASNAFELDSTDYQNSVSAVSGIAEEIMARQTDRAVNLEKVVTSPYLLTLQLQPETVVYGDVITLSGSFISAPSSAGGVSLYLDSVLWDRQNVDTMGYYQMFYPVQRIRTGTHIIYAQYEHTYSEIRTFSVRSLPTRITLDAGPTSEQQIFCSGTLYAAQIPVSSAPLELYSDGKLIRTVDTDIHGSFSATLDLSPAGHRIKVRFGSREFPLEPSEAEMDVPAIPEKLSSPTPLLLALGIFAAIGGAGTWLLLRRRPAGKTRRTPSLDTVPPLPSRPAIADLSGILSAYWNLLLKGEVQDGVHLLYRSLVERIGRTKSVPHAPALTPRELSGRVPELSPGLPEFVHQYEQIRYAGMLPEEKEQRTLTSRFLSLIRILKGDSD